MSDEQGATGTPAAPAAIRSTSGRLVATAVGMTDIGCQRSVNQDTLGNRAGDFAARADDLGLLYAVADGMGGHARGEVASALAIENLFARYYAADPAAEPRQVLARALIETNAAVHRAGQTGDQHGMGTTLTTILLRDDTLYVGNIGDSRTYRVREGRIEQLSHDHSLIGEQVRNGLLTEEQAKASNIRNVITRAVGYREQVEPDTFAFPVAAGDILLLCSDGLHGLVENEELGRLLTTLRLEDAVPALIALARQRGGPDNITALAVRIDAVGETGTAAGADEERTQPLPVLATDDTATTQELPRETAGIAAPVASAEAMPLPAAAPAPPDAATAPLPAPEAVRAGAPPPPAAPSPAALPPLPASPSAATRRAPLWLFVLVPLLILALVGGAIAALRDASARRETKPGALATVAATAPTPTAPPTAVVATATIPAAIPAPTTAPTAPAPTVAASATTGRQEETSATLVSGSIVFAGGLTPLANFAQEWEVALIGGAVAGFGRTPTAEIASDGQGGWTYRLSVPPGLRDGPYAIVVRRKSDQLPLPSRPTEVTIRGGQAITHTIEVIGPPPRS